MAALLPTLGPEAVPVVIETLKDPSLDLGAAGIDLLVRFWATHDPEVATHWAVRDSPPAYRLPAVLTALPIWAEQDPVAARNIVDAWMKVRRDVAEVLPISLVRGWFMVDPVGVAQYIQQLEMGFARQRALAAFVRIILQQQGPELTMRWAESVSEEDRAYKLAVYRQVGAALPLFDRDAALRWCEAQCEGPHGDNLRSVIARRWVLEDGASALEWLSGGPESPETRHAVRRVYSIWAQKDRKAALVWMAEQPRQEDGNLEPWLEPAIPVYARLLALETPAEAVRWAERIEDDEEREIVLIQVARVWLAQDEAGAEAWLEDSPLSEEARQEAHEPAKGPQRPFTM